jgi:dienelactone hydrolase
MRQTLPHHGPRSGPALPRRIFLKASAAALLAAGRPARLRGDESTVAVAPIDVRNQAMVESAPLAMQFRGQTAEACRAWQAEFGAKLRSLLGPYRPPERWECVLERRVELPDHVREERVLTASCFDPVPLHLLLPPADKSRRAGILAIHGHGEFAHDGVAGIDDTPERQAEIARFHYDYGRKLVQRGYVVAAPCLTPFGRRLGKPKSTKKGDPCTLANLQLQYLGKLLIAENLRDILWTLEFLVRQPTIEPLRIGCVGLSYGGRMTMLAAALEPRIRVAAIAGALNCFQERIPHGSAAGCQLIPGLLAYGDVPEISGLIAPRPCVWEAGSHDPHVPADWAEKAFARIQRPYAALGAAETLILDRFEGEHQWHGDVAYQVLEKTFAAGGG